MFLGTDPTGVELAFLGSALIGTLFFLVRLLLMMFGGGDLDDADASSAHDTDVAFKLVSINSMAAFFMMFGWTGLTLYVDFEAGEILALIGGLAAGLLMMALTAWIFSLLKSFTSSGSEYQLKELIGQSAQVYERIPEEGLGIIQITHNGMMREISARSGSGAEIASFTRVKITRLSGSTVLEVIPE